ncbi:MAG: hypothetical protein KIH44_003765 [Octadecabacter sp.]|nr:hypothetical protein [Octadecabacter sp.]
MTVAKPIYSVLTAPSSVMSFLRTRFGAPTEDLYVPKPKVEQPQRDMDPLMMDRSRYARLLDHELDRQLLTQVEREDSDMLNRVRSALYEA